MANTLTPVESAKLWTELLKLLRSHPSSSPAWYGAIDHVVTCLIDDRIQYFNNVAAIALDMRQERMG